MAYSKEMELNILKGKELQGFILSHFLTLPRDFSREAIEKHIKKMKKPTPHKENIFRGVGKI